MTKENVSEKYRLRLNFWLLVIFGGIAAASLFLGLIFSGQTNVILGKKLAAAKEAERPAELQIVILQDKNCPDCFSVAPIVDAVKKTNAKVSSEQTVEFSGPEGKALVEKYNITIVPSLIITGEVAKEAAVRQILANMGEIKDDTFILRQAGAPYVLTSTGETKGRVKVTLLTDRNCGECYDVTTHETILKKFGVSSVNSEVLDVGFEPGRELLNKYKIKALPTFIISGDVAAFPALIKVWPTVGTVETDGVYVFREGVKQMGVYKDLASGRIVKPAENKQQ